MWYIIVETDLHGAESETVFFIPLRGETQGKPENKPWINIDRKSRFCLSVSWEGLSWLGLLFLFLTTKAPLIQNMLLVLKRPLRLFTLNWRSKHITAPVHDFRWGCSWIRGRVYNNKTELESCSAIAALTYINLRTSSASMKMGQQ